MVREGVSARLKASSASGRCRRRRRIRMDRHNGRGLGGERGPLHPGRFLQYGEAGRRPRGHYLGQRTLQRPLPGPQRHVRAGEAIGAANPGEAAWPRTRASPFRDSGDRHQPPGELRRLDRRGELREAGARSTGSPVGERCFRAGRKSTSCRPTGLHDRARYPRAGGLDEREGGAFPPAGGVNAGLCDVKQGG